MSGSPMVPVPTTWTMVLFMGEELPPVEFGRGLYVILRPVMSDLILLVAALAAGAVNSIAGGGTLLSFPALVWLGRAPVLANATNTVALWPGSFAGMMGFRRELA